MNSVLTYIYGKQTETLHQPVVMDNDTEYICVTDNPNLHVTGWTTVVDKLPEIHDNRLKFAWVKLHPFMYASGEKCAVIDGTISQTSSLAPAFKKVKHGLLLKKHPARNNLLDEVCAWVKHRGLSEECMIRYMIMCKSCGIDIKKGPLYESCISIWDNNDLNSKFGDTVFRTMIQLTDSHGNIFKSNQLVMSMLLNSVFKRIPIGIIDQDDYFIRYRHKSNEINHS